MSGSPRYDKALRKGAMPGIRRTAQAEEDLFDLWLYIIQDNPGAAKLLPSENEDKCSRLSASCPT